jgi:hypothetical protein
MRFKGRFHLGAVVVAAAIVVAMSACGGSDDSDEGGGDREQVRATVERLYEGFADGDPEQICDQLNEAAQKELAEGGLGSKTGSCVESYQKFLDESEKAGGLNLTLKAKVKRVKVTGDTAVATVSFGGPGREGEIPLSKIDGEWKLEAVGGAPSQ